MSADVLTCRESSADLGRDSTDCYVCGVPAERFCAYLRKLFRENGHLLADSTGNTSWSCRQVVAAVCELPARLAKARGAGLLSGSRGRVVMRTSRPARLTGGGPIWDLRTPKRAAGRPARAPFQRPTRRWRLTMPSQAQ